MFHLSPATPERFSALAPDPADNLVRLRAAIDRGAIDPAHLLVATSSSTRTVADGGPDRSGGSPDLPFAEARDHALAGGADQTNMSCDVGRVGLYRAGDGTVLTYGWRVCAARSRDTLRRTGTDGGAETGADTRADTNVDTGTGADGGADTNVDSDTGADADSDLDTEAIHRTLAAGIADLARSQGLAPAYTTVVDADEDDPGARRRALLATGWENDGDRLELEAVPTKRPGDPGIEEISPFDDAVIAVMSAAMSDSADTYDVLQVQTLGARRAAEAYRDMMADGENPWLAHRGESGIDGIAAIQRYRTDWCLGYLGVAPAARRKGVGRALATAMVSATADAGVDQVTASVAVGNPAIRATLERVGFTTRSPRTDFVIRPSGSASSQSER